MGGRGANSSINKKLSFLQYSKLHNKQVKSNNDLKALINYNNNKIKILEKEIKETNNNNRHYEIDRLKEENKTYNDTLDMRALIRKNKDKEQREITSSTYKRAMNRQQKNVNSWFGRGM